MENLFKKLGWNLTKPYSKNFEIYNENFKWTNKYKLVQTT